MRAVRIGTVVAGAVARGLAVKDYLASRQLAEDRMFLGAPLTVRSGEGWRPRAELQLAPR